MNNKELTAKLDGLRLTIAKATRALEVSTEALGKAKDQLDAFTQEMLPFSEGPQDESPKDA
jgi:hypothetical protein